MVVSVFLFCLTTEVLLCKCRVSSGLLRSDGLHPSWRGALILSTNIDRALTTLAPQWNRVQARQQAVSQPASLVESATSSQCSQLSYHH
jgi:hypothetical protein